MCGGVKEVFSLCQWAEKPPRKPPAASVSQWMLPTLYLAQKHSQLGNGHYERKIMAQHFSLSGTMGLFSRRHGTSRRGRAAELYFWTWSSITERLCAMWMCQLDRSGSAPSALCCLACCRHPLSQFRSVSSIPPPFHRFIRAVASPGIEGDKKGVCWSSFFLLYPQFWHLEASVPIFNLDSSFSVLPEGLITSKSCFMRWVDSFVFFLFLEHHYKCDTEYGCFETDSMPGTQAELLPQVKKWK